MDHLEHIVMKTIEAANGGYCRLSKGEKLAAALILNRHDWLEGMDYSVAQALEHIGPEWVSLIPAAAKQVALATGELMRIEVRAREESILTSLDTIDLNATLVTYGESPGYRRISMVMDVQPIGKETTFRLSMGLGVQDSATLARHIKEVHQRAWLRGEPLDVKPGEIRPKWID
ncbi:hypothetical protein [Methylovorus glucosotrophus]|uniref:Half a barrel domain-containing protein n=1 Tax=Methylovorus glucosotrophus (strain SIP3-4) TaxID=582744 RepID=C6XEN7_METGS|nr:hypothetical protein [Methylovorus glucosotrophus]ACT52094.1 hypothetical protein Msip34_2870 [Methylovorus glucosotrophus SIP3-4]